MPHFNIRTAGAPGDEILSNVSVEVTEDEFGEELDQHMSLMLETMYSQRGVGLAAPQVGDSRRLIVIDTGVSNQDYGAGALKLVNPIIVEASEDMVNSIEGCLSVPTLKITVQRSDFIKVNYQTPTGEIITEDFTGFPAVVIQHEIDHLNGITLLKHASHLKRNRYNRKMKKAVLRILGRYYASNS
jgi:peptide deformylase